MIFRCTIFFT